MGCDLGRVLRHGLGVLGGAVLTVLALGLVCASPASADDVSPGPGSDRVSAPSVAPPSQQQINDAREALTRMSSRSKPTAPNALARVAGPVAEARSGPATSRISDEEWWTIGAAAMVLLVASETTRIGVRRARHRKEA